MCECGHTLVTVTEKNDGLCVRCTRKSVKGTLGIDWLNFGKLARQVCAPRIPLMDTRVVHALRNNGDVSAICTFWLQGWDVANLA